MTIQILKKLSTALVTISAMKNLNLWYEQFDHINYNILKKMSSVVKGMNTTKMRLLVICKAYMIDKSYRQILYTIIEWTKEVLALVYSDILRPVQMQLY